MTIQEMISETMRTHDLLAAGDGPRTHAEWTEITEALQRVVEHASHQARRATTPRPMIVDGLGLCSTQCPSFEQYPEPERRTRSGRCDLGRGCPTRSMVPCRPWVLANLREVKQVLGFCYHCAADATIEDADGRLQCGKC